MKVFYPLVIVIIGCAVAGCSSQKSEKQNQPDHIVIVVEENHGFDTIIGNSDASFINNLADEGRLFLDSHGVTHPSQPNYIALFSGSTQGVKDDRCLDEQTPYRTPNLGYELIQNGYSFAGYSEDMPENGLEGCMQGESEFPNGSPRYARKHNPWVNWQGGEQNGLSESTNLTLQEFPDDFSKLPTVSFVIPNEDNDMHNGPDSLTVKRGDQWLKEEMGHYIDWAQKNNSLFILTFDEDDFRQENHIPTIFVGPMVKSGRDSTHINHYNLLRTIEHMYGLAHAGPATEKQITGIWK